MAETAANATEGLAPEERLRFDAMLVEQRFADRQILLEEGQPAPGLLLLRAGTVLVNKRDMGGNEQLIIELRAPAVLGELELLTGDLCNTTVVAKGGAVASLLPAATFGRLLDDYRGYFTEQERKRTLRFDTSLPPQSGRNAHSWQRLLEVVGNR